MGLQPIRKATSRGVLVAALLVPAAVVARAQATPAWQGEVRRHVAAQHLAAALDVVEQRLAAAPSDLEARGWRARLLAWSNRWTEAEAEYQRVLAVHPDDTDILVGLSDVRAWQGRPAEALKLLDRAQQLDPGRGEIQVRRGRALRELGRRGEAAAAFRRALQLEPANEDAQRGLRSLEEPPRHELRLGVDFDHFPFAQDAQSVATSLHSRWSRRWGTGVVGTHYHRFGRQATRLLASTTFYATNYDAFTAGGGAGRHEDVIPKGEAFVEYGRGFGSRRRGWLRGAEATLRQHWLWYREARVIALTPGVILYFPRDWSWSLGITAARSRFTGTPAEWRPSGSTRLSFPLHRVVTGNLSFSVGTENFAQADQIGRFSARAFGGGLRWRIHTRQDLGGYIFYQDRSQGRSQVGFGFSYGFRF